MEVDTKNKKKQIIPFWKESQQEEMIANLLLASIISTQ